MAVLGDIRVYPVGANGCCYDAQEWWTNVDCVQPLTHLIFKRKGVWLVFKVTPPMIRPSPEKVIGQAWARGDDGMPFPTLHAARAYAVMRGEER